MDSSTVWSARFPLVIDWGKAGSCTQLFLLWAKTYLLAGGLLMEIGKGEKMESDEHVSKLSGT